MNDVATIDRPTRKIVIEPPKFDQAIIKINGVTPYVQHAFSEKARLIMEAKHREGSRSKKGKLRDERNFEAEYEAAKHTSIDGWIGIPAPCFRNAAISACRVAGFVMTRAKLSLFVEAESFDAHDGTPLIRITGEPIVHKSWVRNETGVIDIRWRPMWMPGWSASVPVRWDADQFSVDDVVNLLSRAGQQVGIGEGRPDSPNSNGMEWGLFEVVA